VGYYGSTPETLTPQILLIPPFAKNAKDGHPINQGVGSRVTKKWSTVFQAGAREHLDKEHEPRDLPKEWSEVLTEAP
jgi:hypothetical protein